MASKSKKNINEKIKNADIISNSKINDKGKFKSDKGFLEVLYQYPYLLIGILALVLYFQSIFFGYVKLDDIAIIVNKGDYLADFSNIIDAFRKDAFTNDVGNFYRPLQTVSFILDSQIAGSNSWMYHLTNVILHIIACCLIFKMFDKLKYSRNVSLIAGVIYAVHPLFTHAVCWIPSRNDLLITVFCLLSFIYFIKYLENGSYLDLSIHFLALLLALFSKETALGFPLLCALYVILKENKIKLSKQNMVFATLWIIAGLIWFLIRYSNIGLEWTENEFGIKPLLKNLLVLPEIIAKFFVPFFISVLPTFKTHTSTVGILIIVGLIVAGFISKKASKKTLLFAALWFLLLIIPGSLYRHYHADIFYDYLDHRAYLPMIGIVLLLAELIPAKWLDLKNWRSFIIIASLITFFFGYSFYQSRNYTKPVKFWASAAKSNPSFAGFRLVLGEILRDEQRYAEAEKHFLVAMKLKPDVVDSYGYLGDIYSKLGQFDKAANILEKAIVLDSNDFFIHNTLAQSYFKLNMFDKAIQVWKNLLKKQPQNVTVVSNIIKTYSVLGEFNSSLEYLNYLKSFSNDKNFEYDFYSEWSEIYARTGDEAKSYEMVINAYNIVPTRSDVFNRIGIFYIQNNMVNQALKFWKKGLEVDANNIQLLRNLYQYY